MWKCEMREKSVGKVGIEQVRHPLKEDYNKIEGNYIINTRLLYSLNYVTHTLLFF